MKRSDRYSLPVRATDSKPVKRGMVSGLAFVAVAAALMAIVISATEAAEIKLLGPVSLRAVLPKVLPQFEQSLGHKVTVGYATLGAITQRIGEGEVVDVAMISPAQIDDLQKQGKLRPDGRVEIARVGYTIFVKQGAPKPDVGSLDAFKQSIRAAKSLALGDPAAGGGSGVYLAGLMQRLELAAEIKAKTQLLPSGTEVAEAVSKGSAEMGIGVASDAAIVPGLEAIPLPTGAQSYSVYVAGIGSGSKEVDAAKALITFLTSPPVKQALTANGFEPL